MEGVRELKLKERDRERVDELCMERSRRSAEKYLRYRKLLKPGETLYEASFRIGEDGQQEGPAYRFIVKSP